MDKKDNSRTGSQGSSKNPGNFANDREKASEAGRKGGKSSGGTTSDSGRKGGRS